MFNPNVSFKNAFENTNLGHLVNLLCRALLLWLFFVSGWGKVVNYDAVAAYMGTVGLPSSLLPLVILLELGGGLAILFGFQTRVIAVFMAVYCILSAILFHAGADDANNFMKNFGLAGGFLLLTVHGAGRFSIDHLLEK